MYSIEFAWLWARWKALQRFWSFQNKRCISSLPSFTILCVTITASPNLMGPWIAWTLQVVKAEGMSEKLVRKTRDHPAALIPAWWVRNKSYLSEMWVQKMASAHNLVHVNQRSDLIDNSNQLTKRDKIQHVNSFMMWPELVTSELICYRMKWWGKNQRIITSTAPLKMNPVKNPTVNLGRLWE